MSDGSSWPAPWSETGGVATADVQGGRGRLVPTVSSYSLARMYAPLPAGCSDVEGTFTFEFTDDTSQGVGFYLRQNGGHLQTTNPAGAGYAAFAESFRNPEGLGLWREVNGNEQNLSPVAAVPLSPGTVYRVRFQVEQVSVSQTALRGKIWPAAASEPGAWTLTRMDSTASLQNIDGGVALDAWSTANPGNAGTPSELFVDDVVVRSLP